MLWFGIVIALQVACIVHVFRAGRNPAWVMAIAFLPMIGMAAYFIVEVLPNLSRDRRVREVKATIADSIDPERRVRDARDAVEFSDTVAHRLDYGDALMGRERHVQALEQYRTAERMSAHADAAIGMRIAEAAYQAERTGEALTALDRLPETGSQSERDRRDLLRAKVLELDGQDAAALALYRRIVDRVAGDEVRCRMAALLIAGGDRGGARRLLQDVAARMKRLPAATLKADAAMYDWAKRQLVELG
ncbi:MAG TPA: PLDc N-terminal domain-containing protein [Sphingopyxis sp.]|nr:PLDc N-terminal domain-containing protein [Sphingopyxis sp.]HMP46589.1 PLDc N-terminal domain-containing protein [Sphingopyxis sp.]HMQ19465.1 PLDc N-terminal domain-containing protein [Sphingopyxis sp.]